MRSGALIWQAGIYSGRTYVKMINKLIKSFFKKKKADMQKDVVEINFIIRHFH